MTLTNKNGNYHSVFLFKELIINSPVFTKLAFDRGFLILEDTSKIMPLRVERQAVSDFYWLKTPPVP